MFGIDIGIGVSSITCITAESKILDYRILFGDTSEQDMWKRVNQMAYHIVNCIDEIPLALPDILIEPLVALEEPVVSYRVRNPKSVITMSQLYALIRYRLETRKYKVFSVNPQAVKYTARRLAFRDKKLTDKVAKRGILTKYGMVRAFKRMHGHEPNYSNKIGRETLADSFFIARTGIDRLRVGFNA